MKIQGISFTEFSDNLLQGYDFACLNKQYGVVLQIGGSDQWGNITSGIDLTRRLHQNQVFGLTVPADRPKQMAPNLVKLKAAQSGWIEENQPVQILPVLDQHCGCRRLPLPEVLHLYEH